MNQVEQCRVVKKYGLLTDDTITLDDGTVLYRIRALIDFGNVKAGELGGYIEKRKLIWICPAMRGYPIMHGYMEMRECPANACV